MGREPISSSTSDTKSATFPLALITTGFPDGSQLSSWQRQKILIEPQLFFKHHVTHLETDMYFFRFGIHIPEQVDQLRFLQSHIHDTPTSEGPQKERPKSLVLNVLPVFHANKSQLYRSHLSCHGSAQVTCPSSRELSRLGCQSIFTTRNIPKIPHI